MPGALIPKTEEEEKNLEVGRVRREFLKVERYTAFQLPLRILDTVVTVTNILVLISSVYVFVCK